MTSRKKSLEGSGNRKGSDNSDRSHLNHAEQTSTRRAWNEKKFSEIWKEATIAWSGEQRPICFLLKLELLEQKRHTLFWSRRRHQWVLGRLPLRLGVQLKTTIRINTAYWLMMTLDIKSAFKSLRKHGSFRVFRSLILSLLEKVLAYITKHTHHSLKLI